MYNITKNPRSFLHIKHSAAAGKALLPPITPFLVERASTATCNQEFQLVSSAVMMAVTVRKKVRGDSCPLEIQLRLPTH